MLPHKVYWCFRVWGYARYADVVKEATPQKPTYVRTEERIVVCLPDLCTVKRAARAGLLMLANKGAVAEASKATCSCTFIVKIVQWSSPVFTDSPHIASTKVECIPIGS